MTHLEEATVVALRDGEEAPETERQHVETCAPCADAVSEAERRALMITEALASLDDPVVELEEARASIRARLDRASERTLRGGGWWMPAHMGRAAAVLLIAAGAVSALPGSPVRQWIVGDDTTPATDPGVRVAPEQEAQSAGVTVPVANAGIRVLVSSLGPLDRLEVVWVDGQSARVDAPPGSRFSYAEGRVEALVAGGPVRIELPRSGASVTVEVDGMPYLTRTGDVVEVTGPVEERTEARILFVAP
ncbi:MAG: hypothetical protein WEA34_11805 [Gemmatimonadota bacterium]